MFVRGFKSPEPKTPYAPTWDFKITTSYCPDIKTKELSKILLQHEKQIKKLPTSIRNGKKIDGNTGLGSNSVTAKFMNFNVLSYKEEPIEKLKTAIVYNLKKYNSFCNNPQPKEIWIQAWFNVLRFGQKIKPHFHTGSPTCYLSGHFNVQTQNTSTVYMSPINQIQEPDVISIPNALGELTLFPSYIFHYTTPHYNLNPRITIAFDLSFEPESSNWIRLISE